MNIFTVLDMSSILSTNTKTYQSLRISTGPPIFFKTRIPPFTRAVLSFAHQNMCVLIGQ